jgi:hypothetical protein
MDDGACVCGGFAPVPCCAAAPQGAQRHGVSAPTHPTRRAHCLLQGRRRTFDSAQSAESK